MNFSPRHSQRIGNPFVIDLDLVRSAIPSATALCWLRRYFAPDGNSVAAQERISVNAALLALVDVPNGQVEAQVPNATRGPIAERGPTGDRCPDPEGISTAQRSLNSTLM